MKNGLCLKGWLPVKARLSLACATLVLLSARDAVAQKKVNVQFEKIKEQCKDVPREQRLTVTVARFNVTTPNAGGEFGGNMATMLSNALQEVNCYRVLATLANIDDINKEINYSNNSGYTDKNTAVSKGKQLSAQVVVTGEVTEFNKAHSTTRVPGVKFGSETVKLGFVIQLINPATREIIDSRSVNVEGKSGKNLDFGMSVPFIGRLSAGGGSSYSPAEANALEQGIIKAVEEIASMKEANNIVPLGDMPGGNSTVITVTNTSYEAVTELENILKATPGVKQTDPNFNEDTAEITVTHEGSTKNLLEALKQKTGAKYKITGLKEGEIKFQTN